MQRGLNRALLAVTSLALLAGAGLYGFDRHLAASMVWSASALLLALLLLAEIVNRLRHRELGVDLIALLAIVAAVLFSQALVAAVIALMLAGGRALEEYTSRRAERELRRLVDRAPRSAWRYREGVLEQVPVESVVPGDRLLLRMGEVVAVDGVVLDAAVTLDESALSGESLPVSRRAGEQVLSGVVNAGAPFDMCASRPAAQSTYAGIVRMIEAARGSRAPFVRMADRYALALIPLTLLLAGLAWWLSGDPVRALAVLVVATPCPLILAVPVAMVAGASRCAQRGILVKNGATLEALARARTLFLDKTGTLTAGQLSVLSVESAGSHDAEQLLRFAASLAQASPHVVAQALVRSALAQGLALQAPVQVVEAPGAGLAGLVDGHAVMLGGHHYVTAATPALAWTDVMLRRMAYEDISGSFIAVDGAMAGVVLFADRLRIEAPRALRAFRQAGIRRIVMLTGDRADVARSIGLAAGVDEVRAELTPAQKLQAVEQASADGVSLMVGDGINDAPALAAAGVGVALGARGATASSEAAGVVLLVDRLDRVAEAMRIASRTRRIALHGVQAGMGLSLLAMLLAALGWLPPLAGAVVQEVIDVAVILNALRALGAGRGAGAIRPMATEQADRLRREHVELEPVLERVRAAAEGLSSRPPAAARRELASLVGLLNRQLIPHELADEVELYPDLALRLHGDDPLAAMSFTHREIFRLTALLTRMAAGASDPAEKPAPLADMQRLLQRLDTVLGLHFSQEDELYRHLDDR
ncbi:MAG: heavy metal translocating P-type ATPase [Pseudomonadota bacterium]|nr:heavy metal translocating P-type ATPase [Pseudomonadota bacterium]